MTKNVNVSLWNESEIEELNFFLSRYYLIDIEFPIKVLNQQKLTPKQEISYPESFGLEMIFLTVMKNYLIDEYGYDEEGEEIYSVLKSIEQYYCFNEGVLNIIEDYPIDERYSFSSVWIAKENNSVYVEIYDAKKDNFITAHVI